MPFKKGESGNIEGRKKGVKNKSDSQLRQALKDILSKNIERLETSINGMDDKEAAKIIIQLARHLTYPEMNPERLTEAQMAQIIEYYEKHKKES